MIRQPLVAAAIAYSMDNQGVLWLKAYDTAGFMICVCAVSDDGALKLAEFILDQYETTGDEIGEVAGHA